MIKKFIIRKCLKLAGKKNLFNKNSSKFLKTFSFYINIDFNTMKIYRKNTRINTEINIISLSLSLEIFNLFKTNKTRKLEKKYILLLNN